MRGAAALLSAARTPDGVWEVVRATGLASAPVAVDDDMRAALRLGGAQQARIAGGVGSFRVLALQLDEGATLREALQRIARRLTSSAPHVLWLVGAVERSGERAAIVAWSGSERSARVASFVWEPDRVVDSDAETLCALASVREVMDVALHARCLDVLGREALSRRFYRVLSGHVEGLAAGTAKRLTGSEGHELALLCVSRWLFLRFLEAKGWVNGEREFVATRFDECMASGGAFHRRVLLPLFFGTLNTPYSRRAMHARAFGRVPFLNGGLFTRTALERRAGALRFPDEQLGALLQEVFQKFRFVAREDSATWSEASVDPEMLGRAFESLMAVNERKSGGVFYTPHALVARVADQALEAVSKEQDLRTVRDTRVLDPACGSGAFLVHVLERLAEVRRRLGDAGSIAELRRDVLARSVFGVDRNPTAVWLCELRLWLSVVIESDETDPMRVPPLPNLDRNIRIGDALAGPGFTDGQLAAGSGRIATQRQRYVRATGRRKAGLARVLDRMERHRAMDHADRLVCATQHARRELVNAQRSRDLFGERQRVSSNTRRELKRLKDVLRQHRSERSRIADGGALPFSFSAYFAEAQAAGGFDVVLGNPPWVRLHRIPVATRQRFRDVYEVFRSSHWQAGARSAHVAPGFASQVDLSALFAERSLGLLRPGGTMALLLPAKLWRSLSGGGIRHLLATRAFVTRIEDASEARHMFDAVVYPSLLVARTEPPRSPCVSVVVHNARGERTWPSTLERMAFDATPGAPWVLLPPDARQAFERLRDAGTPLAATLFGAPRLGVKSGCNAAFLVRRMDEARGFTAVVDASGESGCVESAHLRPALRGDGLRAWHGAESDVQIVWTHDRNGAPLAQLPPRTAAWLGRYHGALTRRADAKASKRWWALFRVDAADTRKARVVWADFGKRPRALVLEAGNTTVPLNTCYVLACDDPRDAWAMATLLNSRLAAAWLNAIAEPARGGYHRYLGWTVGQLPIPSDWASVRASLARAGRSAASGHGPSELDEVVCAAYRLDAGELAPLLDFAPCT
ncbi:MAG: N-6 DNA methylase [Gemmatimonadota bacterium]